MPDCRRGAPPGLVLDAGIVRRHAVAEFFLADGFEDREQPAPDGGAAKVVEPARCAQIAVLRGLSASTSVRISACCWRRLLLLHTQGAGRNVSDIAYTAGFNDLSYFHHAFRRKFGAAPAELQMELGRRH
ncbi:helix-turn-helix domain-containing protein [Bradyrhizobium embrapense]